MFHVEQSPAKQDEQGVDVVWRDARNAACLSNSVWIDAFKLLSSLNAKRLDAVVVESAPNFDVIKTFYFFGDATFSFDIALILDADFCSLQNLFGPVFNLGQVCIEGRNVWPQALNRQLWTK